MHIQRSKPIDSERLKRDLNKYISIEKAGAFSRGIQPGIDIVTCPLCESAGRELVSIYGFQYRECTGCGAAYVSNPPDENSLRAAYKSDYYTAANKILLANDAVIDYRVSAIAEPKVAFIREHLTTKRASWLDVGCGVGEVLAAAKAQGFSVLGLEANPMEGQYASRRFGIEVREEYVSETTLPRYVGQYGIVSLFSVLEHVIDPSAILRDISKIQMTGDNLVVEVPHYPSISAYSQMTFPDHVNRMMHPPLHLFLFPLRSLQSLLGKHGYEVRAAWFFGQDFYEIFSTLGLFAPNLSGSELHRAIAPLVNDFQHTIDQNGLSDEVLLVAEKTS